MEPRHLRAAARALGVSPYAVADLYRDADGDMYLEAIRGIADADHVPQLGTQTWATLEIVDAKLRRTTAKTFKAFEVIKCPDKRIKWDGMDAGSQAIVQA